MGILPGETSRSIHRWWMAISMRKTTTATIHRNPFIIVPVPLLIFLSYMLSTCTLLLFPAVIYGISILFLPNIYVVLRIPFHAFHRNMISP